MILKIFWKLCGWDLQAEAIYGSNNQYAKKGKANFSSEKKKNKLSRKGQQKKRKGKKIPSNGRKKNHLGFDKLNDIMLLCSIHSFSSAVSQENKPVSQNAGKLRPSLYLEEVL